MKTIRWINLIWVNLFVVVSVMATIFVTEKSMLSYVLSNPNSKHWIFSDLGMYLTFFFFFGAWIVFLLFLVSEIKYSIKSKNRLKQFISNPVVLFGWLPLFLWIIMFPIMGC